MKGSHEYKKYRRGLEVGPLTAPSRFAIVAGSGCPVSNTCGKMCLVSGCPVSSTCGLGKCVCRNEYLLDLFEAGLLRGVAENALDHRRPQRPLVHRRGESLRQEAQALQQNLARLDIGQHVQQLPRRDVHGPVLALLDFTARNCNRSRRSLCSSFGVNLRRL